MCATSAGTRGSPPFYQNTSFSLEYEALTGGVALIARSDSGRLRLSGQDALDLLDRLSTNALADLDAGQGAPTVLTSNKGRIMDLLLVLRAPDSLLVLTGPGNQKRVADWIDFYTIVEDVNVEDITETTAMLSLAGPGAAALLNRTSATDAASIPLYRSAQVTLGGIDATLVRTDFPGLPGYDLVVPAEDGDTLRQALLDEGAAPVGSEALETVRVERGVPVFGRELVEAFNPLEAGLKQFISFTKGCYVGQEVVARLDTYDKVQKHLVGLRWEADTTSEQDARLLLGGKQVGVVTTAARSPRLKGSIGLGYVRKAHASPGTVLALELGDEETPAEVAALPFVPYPE